MPLLTIRKGSISISGEVMNSSKRPAGGNPSANRAAARAGGHSLRAKTRKYSSFCKMYLLITCVFYIKRYREGTDT